jgi:hypothetical protein
METSFGLRLGPISAVPACSEAERERRPKSSHFAETSCPSERSARLGPVTAAETMRQFALALLEAADEEGEVGAMTRYLDACSEALNQEALVAISTVAVTFTALASGVSLRAAAEAIGQAGGA